MHHFFLPQEAFSGPQVVVTGAEVIHHLRDVLRLQSGEVVIFLDNSGYEYETVLQEVTADRVVGQIQHRRLSPREPRTKVTLYQAVLKGERFEWALQKGTEIGVSAFVPLLSERCIVLDAHQLSRRKLQRWEKVIQAAAEQCRRGRMPSLQPLMLFAAACEQVQRAGGLGLISWEGKAEGIGGVLREAARDQRPFNVSLFIGPEGGFSPTEVQLAGDYGLVPVSLGPRILRAETAGVVATALILHEYGDI